MYLIIIIRYLVYTSRKTKLKEIKKGDCKQCIECSLNQICTRCPGLAYADNDNLYDCSEWDRMLAIARSV